MPRPQAKGGVSAHHEHSNLLDQTVRSLSHLASWNKLQGYADALDWSTGLLCWGTSKRFLQSLSSDNGYIRLLNALYAATSNGLKQLALSWPQTDAANAQVQYPSVFLAAVKAVSHLSSTCLNCIEVKCHIKESVKRASGMAVEAGLLQNIGVVISKLLANLQSPQHSEQPEHLDKLAVVLLQIWWLFLGSWPGPKLFCSELAATLEPATSLAVALLRTASAAMKSCNTNSSNQSSSSSSSSNPEPISAAVTGPSEHILWLAAASCRTCLSISGTPLLSAYEECRKLECPKTSEGSNAEHGAAFEAFARAKAVLALPDVQRLLLFGLAAAAAAMHKQQTAAGRTATPAVLHTQQKQQPEPLGYQHLLAALGLHPSDEVFQSAMTDIEVKDFSDPAVQHNFWIVLDHMYLGSEQLRQSLQGQLTMLSISEHDMSSETLDRQQADSNLIGATTTQDSFLRHMALPVLETLKDMIIMLRTDMSDNTVTAAMTLSLNVSLMAFKTVVQYFTQSHESPEQQLQVLEWLLHPLHDKVCRAANLLGKRMCEIEFQLPRSGGTGSSAAADWKVDVASVILLYWQQMTFMLFVTVAGVDQTCSGLPDQLVSFMKQHPASTLAAVETLVRSRLSVSLLDAILDIQSLLALQTLTRAVLRCFSNVATDALDELLAQSQIQEQLLSLICSRLKLVLLISAAAGAGAVRDSELAVRASVEEDVQIVSVMLERHSKLAQHSGATEPLAADEQIKNPGQQRPLLTASSGISGGCWLALFGRALYAYSASLQQQPMVSEIAAMGIVKEAVARGLQYLDLTFENREAAAAAAAKVKKQLEAVQAAMAAVQASNGSDDINTATYKQCLLLD